MVILNRTESGKHTNFVDDKNDILTALKEILLGRTQYTDCMETLLDIITINSHNEIHIHRVITQQTYPFHICDVTLPHCRTGFVFMLISL